VIGRSKLFLNEVEAVWWIRLVPQTDGEIPSPLPSVCVVVLPPPTSTTIGPGRETKGDETYNEAACRQHRNAAVEERIGFVFGEGRGGFILGKGKNTFLRRKILFLRWKSSDGSYWSHELTFKITFTGKLR
jgi:hypothetical protein